MAADSIGRVPRPAKFAKGGTLSTRKHRFESFSQRISKLNIDPIRRVRRIDVDQNDLNTTTSFFKAGLDRWKNLNLSENFTDFVREAEPLCDSLPQILHYHEEIVDIVARYIDMRDSHSLEPLLSLLGSFAHDLGVRFESHFLRVVTLVASLAAKNPDVQVIEWSFTCLAWLFKYLSRLLVPDLSPLFHIMAPLLGRERQKIHTTRFAAEAMSFLIRKAALMYHKNKTPLANLVDCVSADLKSIKCENKNLELYQHGLMTLFVDSIKGIDRGLHSAGACVYKCLLERLLRRDGGQNSSVEAIVYGVTIGLIHQTDAKGFHPILDAILEHVETLDQDSDSCVVATCGGLLFVAITVRKGSRIQNWAPVFDGVVLLLEVSQESTKDSLALACKAAAVVLQLSPLEIVISRFRQVLDIIVNDTNTWHFLPFCNYFCDLGRERFHEFILPYFSKFVVSHWERNELELCLLMSKVVGETGYNKVVCPELWQNRIIETIEGAETNENLIVKCSTYLDSLKFMIITIQTTERIMQALKRMIHQSLQSPSNSELRTTFSLGIGLRFYTQCFPRNEVDKSEIWPLIYDLGEKYGASPLYLESVFLSLERIGFDGPSDVLDTLMLKVVKNLHSSSHSLRKLSLQIIENYYQKIHHQQADILTTALSIENSALDLQSARSASMYVRKLSSQYKDASSDLWLQEAIPHFCFGLLTFRLSQLWDDAISALKEISETKVGEEVITKLVFQWLEEREPELSNDDSTLNKQTQRQPLNEFQCSNVVHVEGIMQSDVTEMETAAQIAKRNFEIVHRSLPQRVAGAPGMALRVLTGVPHIAEKRSRQLVPTFLQWATNKEDGDVTDCSECMETSVEHHKEQNHQTMARKDQKAMLNLLGQFKNPRVLYQSSDVFGALKGLLVNGDMEIQKAALNAIFTWKLTGIQPYQENLMNLLDDARFREEISTFVHVDDQDSAIQTEHRQDLIPVLLRILYGKMIARTGSASGRTGQAVKRKAVLGALSRFGKEDLHEFIRISLGPLISFKAVDNLRLAAETFSRDFLSVRKQVGLINMMKDMFETLGNELSPFAQDLINPLLYCMIGAVRKLKLAAYGGHQDGVDSPQVSLLKTVRQVGLQCLTSMFRHCSADELQPYLPAIFRDIISPRLERVAIDTAQSVSGMLQLFSTWASSWETVPYLVDYDILLVRSVVDCLATPSAKDEVKLYVLEDILKKIISLSSPANPANHTFVLEKVLRPNTDFILDRVGSLLRKSPGKELLGSAIQLVSMLAPLVKGSSQTGILIEVSTFLLDQPSQRVSPRSKGDLLQIVQHFVPLCDLTPFGDLQERLFRTVSSLFGYFKDRTNRQTLSQVLSVLAGRDHELLDIAQLCVSLNSFSTTKVDEPDFDERLRAFHIINEERYREFSLKQWRPLVYNMLYYVKDNEELAIRSNASFALRRFVETNNFTRVDSNIVAYDLVKQVLLPALRNGASEPSELVRTEYLSIMAHLVRNNAEWEEINDMSVLLVGDDDEASFFGNILHIQQHRRLRALRRLAAEANLGHLRSANVAHFFLPLIEHFVFDKADDESAHNLCAETISAIGALASSLEWPQFRALFRRYGGYIRTKPDLQKTIIKLLGVIIDALTHAAEAKESRTQLGLQGGTDAVDVPVVYFQGTLSITIPKQDKLAEDLSNNLLPSLMTYLHDKDESTVSLRVPVAVSVVKLLKLLPTDQIKDRLPPVLTDVCHILRSRSQESRDLTRKTLVEISTLVGPACFGFVLKELRSSLARGYQLHVLSFTVHAILVATSPIFKSGDLDYCLPQIVSIIMDDIFGATGQEKDAEEYISKMKEVKSSKSYDSMELVAKTAKVDHLIHLIRPLQTLLQENLDLKMVKKINELLRRIGVGLLRNEAIQSRQVLIFCHEIIREVYKTGGASGDRSFKEDHRAKRFLINSKGASRHGNRGSTSSYHYKLVRFSLDVLRSVLHKYDALQTPANVSGFMPIIGDALVQPNEEVQISALRLLTTIIKTPIQEIDDNANIYVAECLKIFKASTSTKTELAQAALKLVSAILRERKNIEIRENDLAYLLKRLTSDLEEPDRQGVAFNFLKAVMARKIVITEVYEILDTVATIMVTNQTRTARDLARGVYFQFIMDYPQGKGRFAQQLGFLVKNLEYKHQEGRQSIMEAIHLLFLKVGEDLVQEISGTFFVPLVMVVVNDESSKCREMAGALLKTSFERGDTERTHSFLVLLRAWLSQSDQPMLIRVALQSYSIYFDVNGTKGERELALLHRRLRQILESNLMDTTGADWELIYFALQTLAKLCQIFPLATLSTDLTPLWASVRHCLSFPHAWVKLSAAKLIGTYFADFARNNADSKALQLPIKGSGGLWLDVQEMIDITRISLNCLKVPNVSEELANQNVRNLVFLGKTMGKASIPWPQQSNYPTNDEDDWEGIQEDNDNISENDGGTSPEAPTKTALAFILSRCSALIRRGPLTTRSPSVIPLTSSLRLLFALSTHLPTEIITPNLPTLLLPLHNLTDPLIASPFSTDESFTTAYASLKQDAAELIPALQAKVGTTLFLKTMQEVREGVKGRRGGRRGKRVLGMISDPEGRGREKIRRGERKKERRKERGGEERGRRRGW